MIIESSLIAASSFTDLRINACEFSVFIGFLSHIYFYLGL
ncbi:hypothetical protein EcB7A_3344 [Escherichia coli B7A]|nr:hypothetical protein EcB7A_3344 [Escherichia coli B7A]EMW21859.1 hypothetical protein EC2848050_3266 [Escherichia coli 2848050]